MRGEEKREGFPRKPALRRSEKGFRGSRQLSKAVSTPPGAAETTPEKQEGFRGSRQLSRAASTPPRDRGNGSGKREGFSAVAGTSQKPPHPPRLRGGVFPSPPFCQLSPRVILAEHHTYNPVKEVNALKAVVGREVI